ncbi:MAG: hypothetical protein ABIW31_07230 [Novosphingobium sp.]
MGQIAKVILVALAARLLMLLIIAPSVGGDGVYYLATGAHFAQTGHIDDMVRPPLYPVFIAMMAQSTTAIFLAQSLLTTALALITLRLTGSMAKAMLIAACPFFVAFDYSVLAECLLIFLLGTGWLLLDARRPLLAGLCLGLAILTRDTVLLLPLFALPIGWFMGRGRQFVTMAIAAYAVVFPWCLHNKVEFGHFAVSEGRMGYNLWVGTWEHDGTWSLSGYDPSHAAYPANAFRSPAEKQRVQQGWDAHDDGIFKQVAIARMREEPVQTLANWTIRYPRLWLGTRMDLIPLRAERGSLLFTALKSLFWGLNLIILALGLVAMVARRNWYLAIPVAYTALMYVPFHNIETRFTLPVVPFLLFAAAEWIGDLYKRRRKLADVR